MKHMLLLGMVVLLAVPVIGTGGNKNKAPTKETDPKSWTPIKIPGQQRAPEFEDIAAWLNSPALTIKDLQGKVVVVHFMAFG